MRTRTAAQQHKRSLLRASILADVAFSAEEDSSIANSKSEVAKEEQNRAEELYEFTVACTHDEDMRASLKTGSSLRLCLREVEVYGTNLVQNIVCTQVIRTSRSKTQAADILCKELEKEIANAVMRIHDETGVGGTEESLEH